MAINISWSLISRDSRWNQFEDSIVKSFEAGSIANIVGDINRVPAYRWYIDCCYSSENIDIGQCQRFVGSFPRKPRRLYPLSSDSCGCGRSLCYRFHIRCQISVLPARFSPVARLCHKMTPLRISHVAARILFFAMITERRFLSERLIEYETYSSLSLQFGCNSIYRI